MKVLNLYAGLGGNRKNWKDVEVTAVEMEPDIAEIYHKQYPKDQVIVGDAKEFLLNNFQDYDFIWASPPCQKNSKMILSGRNRTPCYPDLALYQIVIFLEHRFKGKYVVENVEPYYNPLIPAQMIGRHCFWANFWIPKFEAPAIKGFINEQDTDKLKEWLGISYEGNIYYKDNHDPGQVLRNCVHPILGEHVFNSAMNDGLFGNNHQTN